MGSHHSLALFNVGQPVFVALKVAIKPCYFFLLFWSDGLTCPLLIGSVSDKLSDGRVGRVKR